MLRKGFLVLVLAALITGGVFAQEHKHEAFDMLLGIGWGIDLGGEMGDFFSSGNGSLQIGTNLGATYDFYIFPWLSASTGLLFGPSLGLATDGGESTMTVDGGIYLTLPLSVHINIPYVELLYLGVGVGFNFPIADLSNESYLAAKYFTSIPIDIGFDFAKTETRSGGRFLIRIIHNIHTATTWDDNGIGEKSEVIRTYGLFWQFTTWKIFEK